MRSSTSSFKKIAVLGSLAAFLVYLAVRVAHVQHGFPVPTYKTESWLADVALMREMLYRKQPAATNTIYVVSGSNALLSLDSPLLSSVTGYQVRNYALHAGLHIDLLFSQIHGKVKRGDVVVAPIEWDVMTRASFNQFDYENHIHAFAGAVDLPLPIAYRLYASVPLDRWAAGIKSYVNQPQTAVSYFDFKTPDRVQYEWERRTRNADYSQGLTVHGDIHINAPMTAATWKSMSHLQLPDAPNDRWIERLAWWRDYVERAGGTFMLVPPVLIEGNGDFLLRISTWNRIEALRQRLSERGMPLHCDPVQASLPSLYRYDTHYHANAVGAKIRTAALADCVAAKLNGQDVTTRPIEPTAAVKAVQERFAGLRKNFGVGDLPFQQRLRDVHAINNAVNAYHAASGRYPASSVPGGWGKPIDLVPQFIGGLPDAAGDGPYLYWSDGHGYKLIAKAPVEECAVVIANWPTMVVDPHPAALGDPLRCDGFGYWTSGLDELHPGQAAGPR